MIVLTDIEWDKQPDEISFDLFEVKEIKDIKGTFKTDSPSLWQLNKYLEGETGYGVKYCNIYFDTNELGTSHRFCRYEGASYHELVKDGEELCYYPELYDKVGEILKKSKLRNKEDVDTVTKFYDKVILSHYRRKFPSPYIESFFGTESYREFLKTDILPKMFSDGLSSSQINIIVSNSDYLKTNVDMKMFKEVESAVKKGCCPSKSKNVR